MLGLLFGQLLDEFGLLLFQHWVTLKGHFLIAAASKIKVKKFRTIFSDSDRWPLIAIYYIIIVHCIGTSWCDSSGTRLGYILKFLCTNVLTNVVQILLDFWNHQLLTKNCSISFLNSFWENFGYFLFQHLVTLSNSNLLSFLPSYLILPAY